jgi:hypothetical protein
MRARMGEAIERGAREMRVYMRLYAALCTMRPHVPCVSMRLYALRGPMCHVFLLDPRGPGVVRGSPLLGLGARSRTGTVGAVFTFFNARTSSWELILFVYLCAKFTTRNAQHDLEGIF